MSRTACGFVGLRKTVSGRHSVASGVLSALIAATIVLSGMPAAAFQAYAEEGAISSAEPDSVSAAEAEVADGAVEAASAGPVMEGSAILIHSYEQLRLIGTGRQVTSLDADAFAVGTGEAVLDGGGNPVTYATNASYMLATDIAVPSGEVWALPEGFSGDFVSSGDSDDSGSKLYDESTDTIYIHNPYQLAVIARDDAADQVVLDGDADASRFGTGAPIISPGGGVLTYSSDHSYVIAQDFSPETPDSPSLTSASGEADPRAEGRDFAGQVLKEIDGKTYILIGNAEQLAAIGSGKKVYTAVYQAKFSGLYWTVDKGDDGEPIMLYGGDADLEKDQNGVDDFEFGADGIGKAEGDFLETVGRCGVNQKTGEIDPNMDIENSGAIYSADANYIIFRDINLNDLNNDAAQSNWTPLTFSGTMVGAKATGGGSLWDGTAGANDVLANSTEIIAEDNPVISNIRICEGEENLGVGFFGALVSKSSAADVKAEEDDRPWWDIVGGLLDGVLGLVGGLLETLGGLVTDVVGSIAGWDSISTLTSEHVKVEGLTLSGVTLDTDGLYQTGASSDWSEKHEMPVGAFAGQIAGDVEVVDCHVENLVSVTGASQVGGFVGKTVGSTDYLLHGTTSGLNSTLEGLGGVLDTTLDFLLPTDDLVGGLVSKLGIRNLVPTKYTPAVVQDCTVSFSGSASVTGGEDYVGGFAGRAYGTKIAGCSTKGIASVEGHTNVGGFAGRIGNAYIMGLLQGLGVNLVDFPVGSEVTNCVVEGSSLKVTSTATGPAEEGVSGSSSGIVSESDDESYVGGFAGSIMASDVVYDGTSGTFCGVKGLSSVTGGGHYVGGFAGYAGVGDVAEVLNLLSSLLNIPVKVTPNGDGTLDLGDGVTDLVDVVLGVNLNGGILSLIGLNSSKIVGCTLEGSNASISSTSGSKVGGFVGFMNGGQVREKDTEATYTRAALEDSEGNVLYVAASSLPADEKGNVTSAVYGRLANGEVVMEDVHGNSLDVATTAGLPDGATEYNVYDTVYLDGEGNPATTATFKDAEWNAVYSGSGDEKVPATQAGQLSGIAYVPVYLQKTSAEGYVQFTRHYMGDDPLTGPVESGVALQETIYRDGDGRYYRRGEGGELVEAADVNEEQLSADALQVATQDGLVDTGSGAIVTTYIQGVASVSGVDDVGGVVGEGRLCSAADVLGNVTAVQYERFEIANVQMNADGTGLTVKAAGPDSVAGGAIGYAAGGIMDRVKVSNVEGVSAVSGGEPTGYAGGFAGRLVPASVAGQDNNGLDVLGVLSVNDLLGAVEAIAPECTSCEVHFADASGDQGDAADVEADVAGGFVGEMQSGTVDDSKPLATDGESGYAVYGLGSVKGRTYAGGFGGMVHSGAIAEAGDGVLSGVLDIELSNLLSVVEAFVPHVEYAGVKSDDGFTVEADQIDGIDAYSGSAGGFVGYASGAQISHCDVDKLKNTAVASEDGEGNREGDPDFDPSGYFDASQSAYAVTGGRYAGGFAGCMDVGSAASVGKGIGVLGSSIVLSDLISVLNVVVTTVEHSDATGAVGGFNVLANAVDAESASTGMAGGFAGAIYGGHVQDSHANNFEYVIGQIAAGGYVGEMEPGDVARLLGDDASVLNSLLNTDDAMASLLQTFVPTVRNSTTDCVPCGGVVRANAVGAGAAGGYVGRNVGGSIWGLNNAGWKGESPYSGPESVCSADRIRAVYGAQYAGGYTGLMEAADTASAGGVSLLGGLISVDNLLGALSTVYPTQENTAVTGPLANLDVDTWNAWVEYVGVHGGYGLEFVSGSTSGSAESADAFADGSSDASGSAKPLPGQVSGQDELDEKLSKYVYGIDVLTDLSSDDVSPGGSEVSAGGYVGLMKSGRVGNSMAYDVKSVQSVRAAGGFAGAMEAGGAASFGSANILGLELDLDKLLDVAEVFVPVVANSSVQGYSAGMTVSALGLPENDGGYAGGYVGCGYGAQIQGPEVLYPGLALPSADAWAGTDGRPAPSEACNAGNLRRVNGRSAVGGFAGLLTSTALLEADASGLLPGILDKVISTPGSLLEVLDVTRSNVGASSVSAVWEGEGDARDTWGFAVEGSYAKTDSSGTATSAYAPYAGGFVGWAQAAKIGENAEGSQIGDGAMTDGGSEAVVEGLRYVSGGQYVGGFFGLADPSGLLEVSGQGADGESATTILDFLLGGIDAQSVDLLDATDVVIENASVSGTPENGFVVRAWDSQVEEEPSEGLMDEARYSGCAGGFGGALRQGTVSSSAVEGLNTVEGASYTGGFIGHMGKSGVADLDGVTALDKLLGATVGVLDLFGSRVKDCSVAGIDEGAVVEAASAVASDPIAGGFVGYGDLGRIDGCSVTDLKKVASSEIAGGFIGKTDMAYLIEAQVQSDLLEAVLRIVNALINALYLGSDQIESIDLVDLNLGILKVEVLNDGNVAKVELLGLPITVSLSKAADDPGQQTDVAVVTVGDSVLRLPCDSNGLTEDGESTLKDENLQLNLIKGNRTEIDGCSVAGVADGYDVFAGGSEQDTEATSQEGMAGGFVGYNHEGEVSNSQMRLCDAVKGTGGKVGPFSGVNDLDSVFSFNTVSNLEGDNNTYVVYRPALDGASGIRLDGSDAATLPVDSTPASEWDGVTYTVKHLEKFDEFADLENAVEISSSQGERSLGVYASSAKAVLMLDADSPDNPSFLDPEPAEDADPCTDNRDLTIQKIWDDGDDEEGKRPDSIEVQVYQRKYDAAGMPAGEEPVLYETVEVSSSDAEFWSSTWRKVVEGLPVVGYKEGADGNPTDEVECYYTYFAKEVSVPGYSSTVASPDDDQFTIAITNKYAKPLPETGGNGMNPFLWLAALLLALGIVWFLIRQRREIAGAAYGLHGATRSRGDSRRAGRNPLGKSRKGLHARRR